MVREHEGHGIGGAFGQIDIGDLGDHVARAVDLHPIAHANILALADRIAARVAPCDVILVMQGRVRYDHTAYGHGRQPRHR